MAFWNKKDKNVVESPYLVVQNNPTSVVSEQFRTIRTNIQFSMVDKDLKTFSVTSAGPASGKSTIAANLAVTFASEGKKTLLIDTDLRKPTIHKILEIRNTFGLTSVLTKEDMSVEDGIQQTKSNNLFVMTSGPLPPNPAELLSTNSMKELQRELEQQFDLVIFDTPPLLAVTDAQIMAASTDGIIFVTPKGEVNKDEVIRASELLKNVDANVLGFIFNKVEKSNDSYYYYYGE